MKIVCDACGAKYSIADDKVQGKVFKIRCKKCSNIIVVRGTAGAAAEEPAAPAYDQKETRVYDYNQGQDAAPGAAAAGDEAVWHVVIDQEQIGPITVGEVGERFAAGQLDSESYVWREGFADWQPLGALDEFAAIVAGGGSAPEAGGGGAAALAGMFGGGDDAGTSRGDAGDLFGSGAAASAASAADDDGAGELFGSRRAPAASAEDAGAPVGGSRLRGERNENSVLFSLGNLAQLASDAPRASAAAPAASASAPGAAGHGGGEGSGLIDIRSMASAYLGDRAKGQTNAPPMGSIGSVDDLPVFTATSFAEPAVLMPMSGSRGGNSKLLYGLIAGVGLLALIAVVLVVMVLKSGDKQVVVAAAPVAGSPKPDKDPDGEKPPGDDKDPESGSGATGSGNDVAAPPTDTPPTDTPPTDKPPTDKPVGATTDKPPTDKPPADKPKPPTDKPPVDKPPADKPPAGGTCDQVSCVINNFAGDCCKKYKKTPTTTASTTDSSLPESLTKDLITVGIGKIKPRAAACFAKSSSKGPVTIGFKVGGDGKVTSASVKSSPDAALGSCVASAAQKGSFAKTQKGGSFAFPFKP